MTKFIVILFLIGNTASLFSQKQSLFIDKNYTEALAESKTQKKPMVLFFYASWCPHCNVMKKDVFTDSAVAEFYSKNYICVAVNAESTIGKELKIKFLNKFRVTSYPTFAILDENETLLYCISGEIKTEKFLSEGTDALLPENQLPNIEKAFLIDATNADKCLKYITNIRKAGIDATPIAQKYLGSITPEDKFTDLNWRVFSNGINNFDTDEFKFVVQNKDAFAKVTSPERVDKKIAYTISETLKPLVDRVDTINYQKKRLVAESFHLRKIDSLLYRFDIQIVSQTTNWRKYQKITSDNVEKFSWNDTVLLYDICTTYFETVADKKGLLEAVTWGKHLLTIAESIDNYSVTSKLLVKLKDYKQALIFAQKGKDFADNLGLKNNEIEALLIEIKKQ